MAFNVMFVCAANVCRSPTAVRIFTGHLPADLVERIHAESAGIAAEPGRPWCSDAQHWVKRHHVRTGTLPEHRARRLTASKTTRAGLVLAADSSVKSAILRQAPRARGRIFTFLEAAALASGVVGSLEAARSGRPDAFGLTLEPLPRRVDNGRLEWLVAEMDAARGIVVPTTRFRRASTTDLLDPHRSKGRFRHRKTLRSLNDAVTSLSQSLEAVNRA